MRWYDALLLLLIAPVLVPVYAFWVITCKEEPQWLDHVLFWYIKKTR